MVYAEIVVNVPIRRTFSRRYVDPPDSETIAGEWGDFAGEDEARSSLQTFHYHVPPELELEIVPGHRPYPMAQSPHRNTPGGFRAAHLAGSPDIQPAGDGD